MGSLPMSHKIAIAPMPAAPSARHTSPCYALKRRKHQPPYTHRLHRSYCIYTARLSNQPTNLPKCSRLRAA